MKKFMMIAVMTVCCLAANAQKVRHDAGQITIQPMIGISTGYWRGEYTVNGTSGSFTADNDGYRSGLIIGAEGEYYTSTDWLSLSAGVFYQQQGWKLKNIEDVKLDYINIPILVNFYVAKGFALKIGLQPGFLVNAKGDDLIRDKKDLDIKSECNSVNFAIPVGLSYEFKNGITLDLRGFASLGKVNKNGDFKNYTDGGSLTIGYKFELK